MQKLKKGEIRQRGVLCKRGHDDWRWAGRQWKCRLCQNQNHRKNRAKMVAENRPCSKCGSKDRAPNGACRPCQNQYHRKYRARVVAENRPCSKCGSKDRMPSGTCRQCQKLRIRRRRAEMVWKFRESKALTSARKRKADMPLGYYTDQKRQGMGGVYKEADEWGRISGEAYEVDHLIPIAAGGKHALCNLKAVPKVYNHTKRDSLILADVVEAAVNWLKEERGKPLPYWIRGPLRKALAAYERDAKVAELAKELLTC